MLKKLLYINIILCVLLLTAWYGMGASVNAQLDPSDKLGNSPASHQSSIQPVSQIANSTSEADTPCEHLTTEFLLANADHPQLKEYVKSQHKVELDKRITLFRSFRSTYSTYSEGILTAIDNGDLLINEQFKPGAPHFTPFMFALLSDRKNITLDTVNQFF